MKRLNKNIRTYSSVKTLTCLAFGFLLCAFSFSSCKKFIEIPPPTSQLVTASVFNNNASATSAVLGIYSKMEELGESFNMAVSNGQLADELTQYSKVAPFFQYYANAMTVNNSFGPWNNAYNYIYQANAVIAGLQQYSGTSPTVKQQLTGEAYFIRAFWHLYLTNCYGAVPVALTTDYTVTDKLARTPRVQVLQQVISDLKTAQSMLNTNYVDATDTAVTQDKVRPNKAVATALLARAYLYLGDYSNNNPSDYTKADSAATAVINNNLYGLSPLSGVFLVDSKEAIWQIATPQPAIGNTVDGHNFILLAAPNTGGGIGGNTISPQLLSTFEVNDQRKTSWVGSITEGTSTYYFPFKYKVQRGGTPISEYTMVLRLAEQYLIRAEAKVHEGNIGAALTDLNTIRTRAGLPNYVGPQDAASVLTAILHERQVELFTEWGNRWFDLNRAVNTAGSVNVNTVMSVVTPFKGGNWSSDGHQQLYPIPLTEIQSDINLTQNAGY